MASLFVLAFNWKKLDKRIRNDSIHDTGLMSLLKHQGSVLVRELKDPRDLKVRGA